MTEKEKQQAHKILVKGLDENTMRTLEDIEPRLYEYYVGIMYQPEHHNAYEILGAVKFLRLLRTYETDIETFRDVVYKYEGIWECKDGVWRHKDGGLKHPGTTGPTYYRLQPFQVFVLASMFLMKVWINTEALATSRPLLDTERVDANYIWDLRRLCAEFTLYTPRKTAKTQLSAFIQFWYFMSGDENAECFCCANASDQAKILFSRSSQLIHQMDPREKRIRFTASQVNWKPGQFRSASLTALSAGGKTKDGLFAQLCSADEYGSAAYVNGASDMGKLVSVVESSMGPRREPMTFISTTAGIIQSGPFIDKLQGIKLLLEKELDQTAEHSVSEDRQACLLLEPDEWEQQNEELLITSKEVRKKVNPMLGIIVQHSFYDDEAAKARQNPEKMNEVITKLLNVYKVGRVTQWIKGDTIRPLQIQKRITDCKYDDGWQVFVGLDFGGKDDLWAASYLGVNYRQDAAYEDRYFADCDAFITEVALQDSPNRSLYERWVADGWLQVCPGEVFNPDMAINEIMSKHGAGLNLFMFAYDPAQSKQPINTLKAWLQTLKIDVATINKMVVPCSQGGMNMNGLIGQLESMILDLRPWIRFSANPLWPWCFGNCGVYAGKDGTSSLRRIEKMVQSQKIDIVHGLLDALYAFNLSEGNIQD